MVSTGMNYWAVLVAGAAYFVLGAVWYSNPLFGKAWMAGIGKTREQVEADFSPVKLVWTLIGSLIAAYGLARIMSWTSIGTLVDGLIVGLLAGVCFVLTTLAIHESMEARPLKLFLINGIYSLVSFAVMGAIIGAWR